MKHSIKALAVFIGITFSLGAFAAPEESLSIDPSEYPANRIGPFCEEGTERVLDRANDIVLRLSATLQRVIPALPPAYLEDMKTLQLRLERSSARLAEATARVREATRNGAEPNANSPVYREYQDALRENTGLMSVSARLKDAILSNPTFVEAQRQLATVGVFLEVRVREDQHLELAIQQDVTGLAVETRKGDVNLLLPAQENGRRILEVMPSECALYILMKRAISQ